MSFRQKIMPFVVVAGMLASDLGSSRAADAATDAAKATDVASSHAAVREPVASELAGVGDTAVMGAAVASSAEFADQVDLTPLRSITVQHQQTLKTLDSFSRQVMTAVTGRARLDGREPLFSVLDMAFRPEQYRSRDVIKIKSAPLRQDLSQLPFLSEAERNGIRSEGRISLELWARPEVQQAAAELQGTAAFKNDAVLQVHGAASTLAALAGEAPNLPPIAVVPPPDGSRDRVWKRLDEVAGNVPPIAEIMRQSGSRPPAAIAGYDDTRLARAWQAGAGLMLAWQRQDAAEVNKWVAELAGVLPTINPDLYPSAGKRKAEVIYNNLAKLTLPGAALYFVAFALFLMAAGSETSGLRVWALRMFVLALLVHTAGIGIRWWLVAVQHGNWFDGIPIKNQFESVLMSAWFGAVVGLILELWRGRSLFGAAASFVGWLSLVAIFTVPYVTGVQIGGEIGQVAGVLMSYWLYLHVTLVTASYALIGMSFLLAIWWLVIYYRSFRTLRRVPAQRLAGDVSDLVSLSPSGGGTLSASQTLARLLFIPIPKPAEAGADGNLTREAALNAPTETKLSTIDACNLVVLQLAFWLLGVGIILGAVWADQSWGRPWGWDPKETFALVTWIVYLVVVHVRVATVDKAWWTAVLSVIGFFVMLFNWIGVNFFLVGLHSYA